GERSLPVPQPLQHGLAGQAGQVPGFGAGEIPQAGTVPTLRVFPVGPVDHGVEAEAMERYAPRAAADRRRRDVVEPLDAALAEMTRLGDQHGASIASPDFIGEVLEGQASGVAQVPVQACIGLELPLVVVVVVQAEQVEVTWGATEFRFEAA